MAVLYIHRDGSGRMDFIQNMVSTAQQHSTIQRIHHMHSVRSLTSFTEAKIVVKIVTGRQQHAYSWITS